jgi:hypothetical protein
MWPVTATTVILRRYARQEMVIMLLESVDKVANSGAF